MARIADPLAQPLAEGLLDCLCHLLETEAPVQCCCLQWGQGVPWDSCDVKRGRDGQAWVRIVSVFPTDKFPQPSTGSGGPCGAHDGWAVVLEMGILRCAPKIDDRGNVSSCEENADAARKLANDAHLMRRALWCCDAFPKDTKFFAGAWEPFATEGGCMGGAMTVTVRADACICNG